MTQYDYRVDQVISPQQRLLVDALHPACAVAADGNQTTPGDDLGIKRGALRTRPPMMYPLRAATLGSERGRRSQSSWHLRLLVGMFNPTLLSVSISVLSFN